MSSNFGGLMKKRSSILKWISIGLVVCLFLAFPFFAKSRYQVPIVNNIGIWLLLALALENTKETDT